MIQIFYAPEFAELFRQLPKEVQKKARRREVLFRQNPFHPSLQTEKLKPGKKEYWGFRLDRSYRVIFRFLDDRTVVFLNCGHHNWIYQYVLTH